MNNYYVYIYLDPRKPGKYFYKELNMSFLYEPFYIGKGKGTRITDHLRKSHLKKNSYKNQKIKKIQEILDINPYYFKIIENLTDKISQKIEIKLIKTIGRNDLNKGPLVNKTDGGDGSSGSIGLKGKDNPMYGKIGIKHPRYLQSLVKYEDIKKNEKENIIKLRKQGLKQREICKIYHTGQTSFRKLLKELNIDTKYNQKTKEYQEKRTKTFSKTYENKYKIKLEENKEKLIDLYINKKLSGERIQKELNISDRCYRRMIKDLNLTRKYIGIPKKAIKKSGKSLSKFHKKRNDILYIKHKDKIIEYIKQGLYQEEIIDKLPFSSKPFKKFIKRLIEEYGFSNYTNFRDYLLSL